MTETHRQIRDRIESTLAQLEPTAEERALDAARSVAPALASLSGMREPLVILPPRTTQDQAVPAIKPPQASSGK